MASEGMLSYTASKHAVMGITKSAGKSRCEIAQGSSGSKLGSYRPYFRFADGFNDC